MHSVPPLQIETLEMCGLSLYVGTSEGRIIRFGLSETKDADGRVRIAATKISEKVLGPVRSYVIVY